MSIIRVLVFIETQAGKADAQIQAYKRLKPLVLQEEGCLKYELYRDGASENNFVLSEEWASQAALDAHDVAPHMVEADARNHEFRAKPAHVIKLVDIE